MNIQRTPWRWGANGALAFMRAGSRKAVMLLMGLLALLGAPAHAEKHIYYVTDAQGTVVATMDSQARVTYTAAYRPYGEQAEGAPQAGPGYTGHVNDPATGLVYMQQRYYDPAVGRFLSPDPVGPTPGNIFNFGRYTYANDNPIRFTDQDGRETTGEWINRHAQQSANAGNHVATYAWAFAAVAWEYLGAESVSQVADKGGAASTSDKVMAVVTIVTLGKGGKAKDAIEGVENVASDVWKAASKSDDIIQVTKDGVAIPSGGKYKIPDKYVENPHRSGSYGEIVNGKFKERLRVDPSTPPGKKGPNYSHYHKNGGGEHYSPRPGDKDPGF